MADAASSAGAGVGMALGGPLGAAAGGALGGIIGGIASRSKRKAAEKAQREALEEIQRVGAPPDLAKQIMMEKFQSAGVYTPKMEEAINQSVSQTAGITEDQSLKDAQLRALESLQQQGRGGITAGDRAALNEVRGEVARDTEAKRQQILQNMQQRGQGGSGAELAAQLQAAQGGSDQQSAAGDRIAAMAQQNALAAIGQAGQLGGNLRSQDLNFQQLTKGAADEMERFNIQNAVNRQQRNIGASNEAQQANLAQQQAIMNANAVQANQEKLRQAEAARQNWQDKLSYGSTMANAKTGQAAQLNQQADKTAQAWQTGGSAIGSGFGALSNYMNSKPSVKAPAGMVKTQAGKDYMNMTDDEEFGR